MGQQRKDHPKNHHYVPQHYLRAWTTDKITNVLPIAGESTHPQNIDSICSRTYLYGNPPNVEMELGNVDEYHSRALRDLRRGTDLLDLSDQHRQLLLSFVTTQRARTKSTRDHINSGEETLREAFQDDVEARRYEELIDWKSNLTEEEKEEVLVDASLLGNHHFLIAQGLFGFLAIGDLHAVLLCNVTDQEFIISDAPMVHDIPQYKQSHGLVPAGLANRGLQIFCPIDRHRMMLLYDPLVYSFNSNSKRQVLIKSPDVVDQLNLLQFHNADSVVVFHSSSEEYIQNLHDRMDEYRRRQERTITLETEEGEEFDIHQTPPYQVPKRSPNLPHCTTMTHLPYVQQRTSTRAQEGQNLVRSVFSNAGWGSDIALIQCVRQLEQLLNL
ncbi:DUF4238 domain-containing protein [Salinigranum salinum]|uniref:DUF4238 domain-containing protein n=1 Tax=Salinigranum salinum TaxID=1364937 RepID=UPI0012607686|nr:DUF4238 domain-containing protein [Salinigranum salinum]